ncbi:hypothetical protein B5S28_g2783 [[Candida] boidinii]|nr:hypothetical protein B5S28_g2783 [[Candida] boidinii]OWB62775.1 hypothetical protein B5S29_g3720 [[Candida] boidinii]OWB74247.1 hypothetical protein B5S31_g4032 [[Candida] boidinii]OWB78290.1 hypothetical protein B5S32_g2480 [[Candida] boidinii]
MADKFPEINDIPTGEESNTAEGDFLSREKELLGDEFATADDKNALKIDDNEEDDDEFEEFKSQYPDVSGQDEQLKQEKEDEEIAKESISNSITSGVTNEFAKLDLNQSEHIKEWKERRNLEISKRDEIANKKLNEIKDKAKQNIDDFYENYNNKKDVAINQTKKEEDEFLTKRDSFLERGTVWDRSIELLNLNKNSKSIDPENLRDKTKFKDLLLALKGKESVPGAAGY